MENSQMLQGKNEPTNDKKENHESRRYDAFISYRHTELDKFVAENLHKQLESFRLPKNIAKSRKGEKTKIERVFRDKEELPLTSDLNDPIMTALHNSEWLIVICSPRLRESLWCKKEIETFVKLRGRERVLAVLIEGEPSESFPDELLFRVETKVLPDGTKEEVKIPVEPLAADVRGKSKKEVLKAMKTEVLRLYAAMFSLNYDDLRQRHKEQKMKRILTASLIGGAACLAFGVYSTATALRISGQNKQIEAQSAEILAQSEQIQQQNAELALKQALSLAELSEYYLEKGDRYSAINSAKEALGESGGIQLPHTAEAQYVLTESVRAYDIGVVNKADYQIETASSIDNVVQSPDLDTLAIFDDSQTITVYDLVEREFIMYLGESELKSFKASAFTFLGDTKFAYINTESVVCIYDMEEKKVVHEISSLDASSILSDHAGKYIAVQDLADVTTFFDGESYEELGSIPSIGILRYSDAPYISEEGYYVRSYSQENAKIDSSFMTVHFFDLSNMEELSSYYLEEKRIQDIMISDGIAYIASTRQRDNNLKADAYITAVDIHTGKMLWENEMKDYYAEKVALPHNEDATDLLFVTSDSVSLLNMKTGETSVFSPLYSEVLEINRFENSNTFIMFCRNGDLLYADKAANRISDINYQFECKTKSNDFIFNSPAGIAVVEQSTNKLTVYSVRKGDGVAETDVDVSLPAEKVVIENDEAIEIAKGYGLDQSEMVEKLYYSDDKQYCFIKYKNAMFVIYDVSSGEVINTMENAYPTEWCLGTDEEGYTYLTGYHGIYILNQDMKAVAWVEYGQMVDLEKRIIYLKRHDKCYEAPIYDLDSLLEIAENYYESED